MTGPTVSEIGEFALIGRLTGGGVAGQRGGGVPLGPGDDAAVVDAPDGRVVACTDMLIEGRHFRLDWSTPHQVGHKAIAQNAADIYAMGARPTAFLVALGCPSDTPVSVLEQINAGIWAEARSLGSQGVPIVGGDLVQSAQITIAVTALGDLGGRAAVVRSGARPGDVVAIAGRIGFSAAGLAALLAGRAEPADLIEAHCRPRPPYAAGIEAAESGATAMIDISDGLCADLGHVARASGVQVNLDSAALAPPAALVALGAELGIDPQTWMLGGGEDHALAATFPAGSVPADWLVVGVVVDGEPAVLVDGQEWAGLRGWQSFD
ncbi:thiamine-phosphate kinase [Tomitella biformata]|uniref:thiamine-phosphate kinase n=1 Tax=Tomitella biformata TaxID=630403 RepID=UPI0004B183A8|nr:thiamine-phosphate kinase [Tomitella biformata]